MPATFQPVPGLPTAPDLLAVTCSGPVLHVRLNRPAKRNEGLSTEALMAAVAESTPEPGGGAAAISSRIVSSAAAQAAKEP